MTSKTKTTAKKEEATPALVPKLRFPKFQDTEEWKIESLGQLADYENGKAYEQDILENGKYVVVNSRFISTDGAVRKYTNADYLIAKAGEVLMVLSDLPKGRALAKCYFVKSDDRYAVNQRVCRLKPRRIDGKFLYYTLNRHPRLLAYDDGLSQTHLSKGGVIECPLCVPTQKSEQQKIAECLSSVDELMAAQARKVDALKTHKKGLMQQLFPREGETQPRLRFPEFQNAGEWEEDTLDDIATFRRGSFPQPYGLPEWYDEKNGMPFIQVFDVGDDFRLKDKTKSKISKLGAEKSVFIPEGTLIVTLQGSIGRVAITHYDAYIDRTLLIFESFQKPIEKVFFSRVIQNLFDIEKEKAPGGIIKTITKESLSDFKVKYPTIAEQQRIASCLSSLDALITAETQKHEALKIHKKGLMQQLFPTTEEVEA